MASSQATRVAPQAGPSLKRSKSIRNEKPPNSRQPAGLRDKILRASLPHYSGPYSVGLMDIEVPAREPRTFSQIKRDGRHLLKLETVLFTIFYPSKIGSGTGVSPEGEKRWGRATWVPRPRSQAAKGYAKFAGLPSWVMIPMVGLTTYFTKIPAWRNAHLAEHWPPDGNSRTDGYGIKNKKGTPPPGEPEQPVFPLLIFSHGLGGTRTTYSSICGEFASHGFIVIALEHRDGSGPRTFINMPNRNEKDADNDGEDLKDGFSKMDYVFPKGNEYDTSPSNEQGVDKALREAQIELRLAEIQEAYYIMSLIHAGKGDEATAGNLRSKEPKTGSPTNQGGSSRGLKGVVWAEWTGRFHLDHVTMVGHSFGAATTVQVLRSHKLFPYISQSIIYDIWGAAVSSPTRDPDYRIRVPVLAINSEAFTLWPANFDAVIRLCNEVKEQEQLAWLLTVRGSVHVSQSDFSLLYPHLCSLVLKMTVNPRRALDININASLEFLRLVMPPSMSRLNRGADEHLLQVEQLERIPSSRRPDEGWMAVRLKIPNEFFWRCMTPFVRRKIVKRRLGKTVPTDPGGRKLDALQDLEEGDEIWVHFAPEREELEAHGLGEGVMGGSQETLESGGTSDTSDMGPNSNQDSPGA